jgi:probable HAF family extracellular repeat protein
MLGSARRTTGSGNQVLPLFPAAAGINIHGQVVGQSATTAGASHAFLWEEGHMRDLGTLGGAYSSAAAINDHGQIVGESLTADGAYHAALWVGK